MPERFTEGFVKALKFEGKPYVVRDTRTVGFMVAVNKSSKSYKVQRDLWIKSVNPNGPVKTVRKTIGKVGEVSLSDARTKAEAIIEQIKGGIDPNSEVPIVQDDGEDVSAWSLSRMFAEYMGGMKFRGCTDRSVEDVSKRFARYLSDWADRPMASIKRSEVRAAHMRITEDHGPVAANQTMRDFRAAYNFTLKTADNVDDLPENPVRAVTFNKERGSDRVIMKDDLPDWWAKVCKINNPMRRDMHLFGLLSGLRPGTLVTLKRDWVDLPNQAIRIPRMKSGRKFDLPLSKPMVKLMERILAMGAMLYPDAEWVFPTRSSKTGEVIATQVWKEKVVPSETGHILRHTYKTLSQENKVDLTSQRLLLDHSVPGIDGVYTHAKALFESLLNEQEKMSSFILETLNEHSLRQ